MGDGQRAVCCALALYSFYSFCFYFINRIFSVFTHFTELLTVSFVEGFLTLELLAPLLVPVAIIAVISTIGATPSKRPRPIYDRNGRKIN